MVLVYLLTVIILASWITKMILARKIIFRRTILDIPLLIFILSQTLSTIFSIDPHTSFLGYYSRFHGGLASTLSYTFLYWAYVSNMDRVKTISAIKSLLASAAFVSTYGVLEHFGIDKNIWVQDVQNRVFSTLGQPNWLAAWLVALMPISWTFTLKSNGKKNWINLGLSFLFFLTLLYTKSRSGILGFAAANLIFWSGVFFIYLKTKEGKKLIIKRFATLNFIFLVLVMSVGTPWTASIKSFWHKLQSKEVSRSEQKFQGPVLEVGGTESGEIRKIVWRGAIDIWKNYPILGSGVETFAYSYYNFRPVEHNQVSEWDFLYNKAHNEYLNFMATTGTFGIAAYIFLFGSIVFLFTQKLLKKVRKQKGNAVPTINFLYISFLSGFVSILVTNFFGFSVVPVALQFFLYPAMAISLETVKMKDEKQLGKPDSLQKVGFAFVLFFMFFMLFIISKYWYADTLFAKGKLLENAGKYSASREILIKAVRTAPFKEALYYDELSQSAAGLALTLFEAGNNEAAKQFAQSAVLESDMAIKLSPKNVNLKRNRARLFTKLSAIEPEFLVRAEETILDAIKLAPTDAKLYYHLALNFIRQRENDKAIEILKKTIKMKENYRDARFALGLLLVEEGKTNEAKKEFEYILKNINPKDKQVQQQLEELSN